MYRAGLGLTDLCNRHFFERWTKKSPKLNHQTETLCRSEIYTAVCFHFITTESWYLRVLQAYFTAEVSFEQLLHCAQVSKWNITRLWVQASSSWPKFLKFKVNLCDLGKFWVSNFFYFSLATENGVSRADWWPAERVNRRCFTRCRPFRTHNRSF